MRIIRAWNNRFRWMDPLLGAIITVAFACWLLRGGGVSVVRGVLHGNRAAVYGTIASIFGSLLGFVIAAIAIVLGYADTGRLSFLRDSGRLRQLWKVFSSNIWWLAAATLASLLALIFDRESSPISPLYLVLGFYCVLMAAGTVVRSVWTLEQLIRAVTELKVRSDSAPAMPGAGPSRLPPRSEVRGPDDKTL